MLSSKFSKSTHSVEKCIVLKNGQTYFKVAKHTLKFLQKKRYVLTFSTLYIEGLNGHSFWYASLYLVSVAVVQWCSVKKVFLKISENSQENNTCAFNLNTLAQVFSCEFSEIFKNTFFCRTPLVSASVSIHLSALKTKFIITDIIHNNLDIITVLLFILILHGNNSMLDVGIFLTHFSDTYCRFKTYLIKLFH